MKIETTPGDAALMNTSVGAGARRGRLRVSMSRCTAAKSLHSMGPSQAGRWKLERVFPVRRATYSGKSRASVQTVVTRFCPPNPVTRSLMYVA